METGLYTINSNIILSIGTKNSVLYDFEAKKMLHISNLMSEYIIEKAYEKWPEQILKMIGTSANISKFDADQGFNRRNIIEKIFIDMTDACNFSCKNCFHEDISQGNFIDKAVLQWIDKLPQKDKITLVLMGGEPLLYNHKELIELIKRWAPIFNKITIFTNGSLLTDEMIDICKEYNVLLRITFYSTQPAKHEQYTGIRDSFNTTIELVEKLIRNKNLLKINLVFDDEDIRIYKNGNTVFHSMNVKKYIDSLRPTHSMNVKKYIDSLRPTHSGETELIEAARVQLGSRYKPISAKSLSDIKRNLNYHSCTGGKISIDVKGDIYPCPWNRVHKLCNIRDVIFDNFDDLENVFSWRQPIYKTYSKCSVCEFKFLCFDCTYMNQLIFKNHQKLEQPLYCTYNPTEGRYYD